MTNKEWLATLNEEELGNWLCEECSSIVGYEEVDTASGEKYMIAKADKLSPRLMEIKRQYNSSISGVKEWLKKEHIND